MTAGLLIGFKGHSAGWTPYLLLLTGPLLVTAQVTAPRGEPRTITQLTKHRSQPPQVASQSHERSSSLQYLIISLEANNQWRLREQQSAPLKMTCLYPAPSHQGLGLIMAEEAERW